MNTKSTNFCKLFRILLVSILLTLAGGGRLYAQYYPVHATVQWPSPQSPYLSDYYSGSRDRLIVTLLNRDLQQPLLFAKLRIKIKSIGFLASSREEGSYPILELNANVPTRLTNIDLAPYLQPQNLQTNGNLRNGQLPVGYTEFSIQVIDYYTGRALSDWHSGRSYLDVKKPPLLNFPEKDAQIGITEPLYIRFQWMPRHQGLAGTEYEFVLKELPDNGAAPQSAFAYGNEIYRVRTRNTTLNYTHLEPILFPNRRYAWQVQAIARDGVDEVGMFENGGLSEINWFYLNDNCQAPTGLKALPRFAKVELSWNKVIGTTGYVVECRPKTKLNVYEWSSTRVAGEYLTLAQLKPGWTYEWRVGTLCTDDRPVFSDVREFTLSSQNDELLADCGKEPVRPDLSQEPNLRIKAGDIVTIGGDYPMTIIEAVSLGDGWYSGRGKTRLKTIIDAPVSLRFDRLRINVDNFQIDGTVEASYDEKKGKAANLDYVDDGGKDVQPATIRMCEHKMDFTLPDLPQFTYNPTTGEIETTDAEGNPQTIKIDVPENASYESIFPMLITDKKGNTYQISPAEQNAEGTGNDVENENKDGKIGLDCERVDRVGDFNTETLSSKYGYVHFERGEGKYAFDNGQEKWYKKSVKVDRFYKPFAKGYIAPWKLVPTDEKDIVTARYDGLKNIDLKKVRFVSEPNSAALPARLNETEQTWSITLKPVATGAGYDVFAVYEGVVIGKLRVVSYAKQQHKVTLVPINEVRLDKAAIEQELNGIYNPVGVQFTVNVDERMRDNYAWEVESEKDGLLSTVGKSFWGYDKELKESTEMLNLQKTYQKAADTLDGAYLFILNGAKGLEEQKDGLLGEMPRKSRFGYIFAGNSPNTEEIVHTIAHELGHGIFTLQHTFDAEYGKDTQGETNNLLDYPSNPLDYKEKTELAAFQWNVMANPAVFTAMDKADEGDIHLVKGQYLGFTPDGRVIQARPKEYAGIFDNESSYFIYKFKDKNGTFYKWTGKNYTNDKGDVFDVPDVKVNGKVAIWRNSNNPQCYVWYKFLDVRNYTSAQFEQIKQRIAKDDGSQWELDLVDGADASPACKDAANAENEKLASLQSFIHFTEHANISRFQILSELAKVFQTNRINTLTNKEFDKKRVIIISIEGYDDNEVKELKGKYKKYLHFIFSNENGTIKFSRIESSDEFIDKLSHISELIKEEPWAAQAIILYEVADLLDKGINHFKIPEFVWSCNGESTIYKKIISYLLIGDKDNENAKYINELTEEYFKTEYAKFAFLCGLWDGVVGTIETVPDFVKILTCAFHGDCRASVYNQWVSFHDAVIKDEDGNILCSQDQYLCKAWNMATTALTDLVEDECKFAHTAGTLVAPVAVIMLGDVAAAPGILETLGTVGSGVKYAIQGLQFCEKITDITRPLAKGLKATTVFIKKAGKLVPELHIGDNITLHIDEDKWFLRNPKVDAGHATAVDESNLAQKIEDALSADMKDFVSDKFKNLLLSNERFMDVLKRVRIKRKPIELEDFAKMFEDLHKAVPKNSVKPLKDVMDDFVYLVDHHLSDMLKRPNGKKQITAFFNELLQSKDKFKAGTTTLEVIRNPQKYISNTYHNTLSNLELEDFIAYADDAGDFRFDIKWEAISSESVDPISIFVDTKNYSSARNMFKNLRQFKAYIKAIDNFDQLYIIQQGGRDVTKKDIIKQLEKAIANDAKSVFRAKPQLWKNMDIDNFEELKRLCQEQKLSQGPEYEPFRNMILTTK